MRLTKLFYFAINFWETGDDICIEDNKMSG